MESKNLGSDPNKSFPGKSLLIMGPLFSDAERYVYYCTDKFLNEQKSRKAIWISTDTPYDKIKDKFLSYGVSLGSQKVHDIAELASAGETRIFFLDMISHKAGVSRKKREDCRYIRDPSNLTELSLALNEIVSKNKCGIIVLDSLNSLLVYNDLMKTLQFLRFLSASVYEKGMTLLVYYVAGEHDSKTETAVKMAVDAVLTFDRGSILLQSESSKQSFNFEFSGGNIKLSKA